MNRKENFLEAISFDNPEYMPLDNEPVWYDFSFEGIMRMETWTDRWGVGWVLQQKDIVPFPKVNPLADIRKLDDYSFPSPEGLVLSEETMAGLSSVNREEKLVRGNMSYFIFERAWALMGMENFMMALIDYPAECRFMLHEIARYARGVFAEYMELGADGIEFSEDLGSQRALMISPALFREFILPEYIYCFQDLIKEKKIINFHSCGCINSIASDLASAGVSVLNPVQSRANDLVRLKADTNGKMALSGAVDTDLLIRGTPEQVRAEVIRVINILKPGGGYICGPDQYFPDMPRANLDMLWDTASEFGRY